MYTVFVRANIMKTIKLWNNKIAFSVMEMQCWNFEFGRGGRFIQSCLKFIHKRKIDCFSDLFEDILEYENLPFKLLCICC